MTDELSVDFTARRVSLLALLPDESKIIKDALRREWVDLDERRFHIFHTEGRQAERELIDRQNQITELIARL